MIGFAPYLEGDDLAQWSLNVKIRDGWVCTWPGCGVMEKRLLESHHIKPKNIFPQLAKEVSNGETLCMYHHAVRHWDNIPVREKILARLAIILWPRYAKSTCKQDNLWRLPQDNEEVA